MKKEIIFCKTTCKNIVKYEGILITLLVIIFPTKYTQLLFPLMILQIIIITSWWFVIKFEMAKKIKKRYPNAIKNIYIRRNFDFAVFRFELKDTDKDLKMLRKKAKDLSICSVYSFLPVIIFTVVWIVKFVVEMT